MAETNSLPTFFVIAPPGLEAVVLREFAAWMPDVECKPIEKGGFEFQAPLEVGCGANLVLKTPTRILLRLADFGCRDFPKLFKKIRGFDWAPYLAPNVACDVEASTHGSRLKIKKRIEETVLDGLKAAGFDSKEAPTDLSPTLYIRVIDDVCFVSLDTSGGILHKRGDRKETPDAPLRESLAAILLWSLAENGSDPVTLVDPMMGSGTFLTEAKQLGKRGSSRSYAFMSWPVMKSHDVAALVAKFPTPPIAAVFEYLLGFERDAETAKIARKRLSAGSVIEEDFFESNTKMAGNTVPKTAQETWLICNPPYGRRLKVDEPLTAYYGRLFQACEDKVQPDRAGFIIPHTAHIDRIKRPKGWVLKAKLPFSNGGIPVTFYTFARVAVNLRAK